MKWWDTIPIIIQPISAGGPVDRWDAVKYDGYTDAETLNWDAYKFDGYSVSNAITVNKIKFDGYTTCTEVA